MTFKQLLLPLLLICIAFHGKSQSFNKEKLDSFMDYIDEHEQGMHSVSIMVNGEHVYQKSIGFADVENAVAATNKTKYRIGSISKTFTAVILMQLIDEGKISLSTPLADFYPEVPNAADITVEHLLRHRSGLFNFTNSEDYTEWMESPITEKEFIRLIKKNGTIFTPGSRFEYSNTNYVLLSLIAEKLDGKPFKQILSKRVTTPLELQNTYYGGKINPVANEAYSYTRNEEWTRATETDMSVPLGAGAIVSTPEDINSFFTKLFNSVVVSDSSLMRMKNMQDGYGLGLFTIPFNEKISFGHTGGIDGFVSMASYFPDDKLAVAFTSNGSVHSTNAIMIGILSIYFGKEFEFPQFIEVTTEQLDSYTGIYSSPQLPLELKIFREGIILLAQGTGQPSFQLEGYDTHKFKFDRAGLTIEFKPDEGKLILNQGGASYEMIRKDEN